MTKKFRFRCRLLLVWLIFAVLLQPAAGFSRAFMGARGGISWSTDGAAAAGSSADTIRCWEVSCLLRNFNRDTIQSYFSRYRHDAGAGRP